MVFIVGAEYMKDCIVNVVFNDGIHSRIDLRSSLENDTRPIARALLDPSLFAQVSVDMDTLVWPNGFDLAPEYLYELARVRRTA